VDRRFADVALHNLQAKLLYNQEIRVNWAFQSHQREDTSAHHHIFVGDIGQEVTDAVLLNAFAAHFSSCSCVCDAVPSPVRPGLTVHVCRDARVMWDHNTGRSKGYGFVSFRTKEDADSAIQKMQGQFIGSRRVRCGWAQHKQVWLRACMLTVASAH
jgi:nucleolysin TIA-1/TIAR